MRDLQLQCLRWNAAREPTGSATAGCTQLADGRPSCDHLFRDAVARDGGNYTHIDSYHYRDLRPDDIYDFRSDLHNLHNIHNLKDVHDLNEHNGKFYNIHNKFDDLPI